MKTILFRLGGKILPILAATAMAAPNLSAQDDAGVRLGIKVAPNMSWIKADTKGFDGDGSKIGFARAYDTRPCAASYISQVKKL